MVSKQYKEFRGSKVEYVSVNERAKKVEVENIFFLAVVFDRRGSAREERCRKKRSERH